MAAHDSGMLPVKVDQLFLSNLGFVVLLKGVEDPRSLPIFIGAAEAQAIAIRLNGVEVPRPLTHDLLKNLLDFLECRLMRIEVSDLKEGTFYANLVVERDGTEVRVDARPSDAIALALRAAAPVFVAARVMDEAGKVLDKPEEAAAHAPKPRHEPTRREALQRDLDRAIAEERYEDAARLRDEIQRQKTPHAEN
jgi:uncharacterized protein